jgi:rod shape-determining protein MreC
MESFFSRYKNFIVLGAVLVAQILGLAVQVRRTNDVQSTRLIRIWAVTAVTPFEKAINWVQNGTWSLWHNYFYLRGVRAENRALKAQIEQLRLEQTRLSEDANQARRLQSLLAFKEQYIQKTLAAQVIGTSGSEQSRAVFIDKGKHDGVEPDMAVITADGIVGKVLNVFPSTSQVLLINDQSSGVGAILEKSRLQGIVRGSSTGTVELEYVMSDEQVSKDERVLTSGGDGIFPKGLPIGTVTKVSPGHELFLNIQLQPAANLWKLEEVLVVTEIVTREPSTNEAGPVRAVDILAQRLPTVPDKPEVGAVGASAANPAGTSTTGEAPKLNGTPKPKPDKPVGDAASPRIAETAPPRAANPKPATTALQGANSPDTKPAPKATTDVPGSPAPVPVKPKPAVPPATQKPAAPPPAGPPADQAQ